nr:zinc finger, CCHC-type [Tanacetum cinerariifolium]
MAGNTVKKMTTNFEKLDKFEGHDFRRWQKKMHFLLTTLKVVYVLTTLMPELLKDATVEAIRIRAKWKNDDYICRGHILNGMSDSLFDVYTNVESAKEPVMEQYNELLRIIRQYTQHGLKMDESNSVSMETRRITQVLVVREKGLRTNPKTKVDAIAWWIDSGATTRVCKDRCWFKTYEPVEDESFLYMGDDHFVPVHEKGSVVLEISYGKSITLFNVLCEPKLPPYTPQQNGVTERKNRALKEMVNSMLSYSGLNEGFCVEAMLRACYLLNRVPNKRNKTTPYKLWFYVIKPNDSVSINSIIESRDAIFNENCFSSIPRPKDIILNLDESQKDDHSDDVPSEIPKPCKGKLVWKAKSYGSDFQLYLVEASRDQIKEDPRTYNEVMQSCDASFWKEAIDDEIGSIMENNTWVLSDLPRGCKPLDVKTALLNGYLDEEVYMKQPKGFVMPGNEHKVCKLVKSLYGLKQAPKQWHQKFDELEYSRAIGCLMYAMTSTRADIAYVVGRLSRFTSNPSRQHWKAITRVFKYLRCTMNYFLLFVGYPSVLEAYSDASWINHVEDSSSTSGWVFLLGEGAISWAFKKQTCITGSTMESEFVALAATGKEAEWLKNLIHEISIWLKPIAPISIRCDSAPTMARAYSQIYNRKSRHLGARTKMTTYVNMKFCRFKKLGLGFLYVH